MQLSATATWKRPAAAVTGHWHGEHVTVSLMRPPAGQVQCGGMPHCQSDRLPFTVYRVGWVDVSLLGWEVFIEMATGASIGCVPRLFHLSAVCPASER